MTKKADEIVTLTLAPVDHNQNKLRSFQSLQFAFFQDDAFTFSIGIITPLYQPDISLLQFDSGNVPVIEATAAAIKIGVQCTSEVGLFSGFILYFSYKFLQQ